MIRPVQKIKSKILKLSETTHFFTIMIICIYFIRHIIGRAYTHWDTFDLITTNFVFFSDSIKSGYIPFWNPFVLSGVPLLASGFSLGLLFSPIDFFLILISSFTSPIYMMELNVLTGIFLFYFGSYFLINIFLKNKKISAFTSLFQVLILTPPIIGQIGLLYSLALLPWLIYFSLEKRKYDLKRIVLLALFISSITAKSYFYYIFLFFMFSLFISFWSSLKQRSPFKFWFSQKFLIFTIPTLLFLILNLEGTLDFIAQYKDLYGDLIIKEPRMRQIVTGDHLSAPMGTLFTNLFLIRDNKWDYMGFSYFTPIALPILLASLINFSKQTILKTLCLVIGALFFISASDLPWLQKITNNFPIISSFRWNFYNVHLTIYAVIFYCSLSFISSRELFPTKWISNINKWFKFFILTVAIFYGLKKTTYGGRDRIYNMSKDVKQRTTFPPVYYNNERIQQKQKNFKYNDFSWLSKKVPISHGYDNTASEYYWRMKDMPFLSKIVSFSCRIRPQEKINRNSFSSDNEYVDRRMSKIDPNGEIFIVKGLNRSDCKDKAKFELFNQRLTPNSLDFKIRVNGPGIIAITQQLRRGWKAFLNGKEVKILRTNYLFQGIPVNKEGEYSVELRYFPATAKALGIFYFAIFLLIFLSTKNKSVIFRKLLKKIATTKVKLQSS